MKSSSLLPLLFMFAACTESSHFAKWQAPHELPTLERVLASEGKLQCMYDVFSPATLKKEVEELERFYAEDLRVEGSWKHLDLSLLPVPQAQFLKSFGKAFPEKIDYSLCRDLPCLINLVYGKRDHVAGLVHYLWYLKFNHLLAFDDHVPRQESENGGTYNGRVHSLKDYLWSDKELYGLWRVTHLVKFPHPALHHLKEVQRLPKGEAFEEKDFKASCGLASPAGWIKFTDKCLILEKDPDQGHFYPSLIHEFSHQIDYDEGRRLYQASHRSHQPDYLKLSGFYLKEYQDERGFTFRQWKRTPASKVPTPYSALNPQENFAEMMAYFRVKGNMLKQGSTAAHYRFISDAYYGKGSFESEALALGWLDKHAPFLQSLSLKGLSPAEIEKAARARVMVEEPEACSVLKDKAVLAKWKKNLKERLKQHKSLDAKLLNPELARETWVNCFAEQDPKICYESELNEDYLSMHPYEEVTQEARNFYRGLVGGRLEQIRLAAKEVWGSCRNIKHNDEEIPTGNYFHLSEGYMVSSFYNCLNAQLPVTIKKEVKNVRSSSSKEELVLFQEIKQQTVKFVHEIYETERSREASERPEQLLFHLKKDF